MPGGRQFDGATVVASRMAERYIRGMAKAFAATPVEQDERRVVVTKGGIILGRKKRRIDSDAIQASKGKLVSVR